jgi:hypothetical protein
MKILVLEDDPRPSSLLLRALRRALNQPHSHGRPPGAAGSRPTRDGRTARKVQSLSALRPNHECVLW